ncbi:MAG: hypothetical protein ACJAV5_001840 [Vicingaceae bacterium]|jgi:hypothetical protein
MVWSFLAVFSYWAYSNPAFQENFSLIGIEYTVVIALLGWEVFGSKSKNSISVSQKSNYL